MNLNNQNQLEKPWLLDIKGFEKRAQKNGTHDPARFKLVRDETAALTEEIAKLEAEIDRRVASLYGVG